MSELVRVRHLTDEEGRRLQRLVRRGEGKGKASVVRYRRALVILAYSLIKGLGSAPQTALDFLRPPTDKRTAERVGNSG